jgi:hypothetical protein
VLGSLLALTLVGPLSACGQDTAGGSSTSATPIATATTAIATAIATATATTTNQGTITGDVTAGPTCPVQTAETPCPPKVVSGRTVQILDAQGAVVATTTTDVHGRFSVAVAPGTYSVVLPPLTGQPRQASPTHVTVAVGQTVHVQIMLDTGIR